MVAAFSYFGEFGAFFLTFTLTFTIMYAVLTKTKYLSSSDTLNAVIAFPVAMLVALSGAFSLLSFMTPFLVVVIIFTFGVYLLLGFMKIDSSVLFSSKAFQITAVLLIIFTVIFGTWSAYKSSIGDTMRQLALLNGTENDTEKLNLTGNVITDTSLRYEYYCSAKGMYFQRMSNLTFWCTLMHPRILGAMILLVGLIAIISFWAWFATSYTPKSKK